MRHQSLDGGGDSGGSSSVMFSSESRTDLVEPVFVVAHYSTVVALVVLIEAHTT